MDRLNGPITCAMVTAFLALSDLSRARAATLYWDTDGSMQDNSASTGANLGGAGIWSNVDANWWNPAMAALQVWPNANDAVFWGTMGAVTASTVSPRHITFKTTGFSISSGTLSMAGAPSNFTVDDGVTATISSTIAGPNSLVKLGPGLLILANAANANTANSTAGGWRIEGGGILRISADGCLGAPLPDTARNTVTDIQINQSTIQAGAPFTLSINRRTKLNTNASTNRGDAIIDTHGNVVSWFGSIQGGAGSLRVMNSGSSPGLLILGTDKIASINPFGSILPAGAVNLTVSDGAIVQTSGTVTPTGGELGSETGAGGAPLAIKLDNGQIRSESGPYFFQRSLILGPGGGSLDVGAWEQTFTGTVSGPGLLSKEGTGTLVIDNSSGTWTGGTRIRAGTLQLGRGGSFGLLPGVPGNPSSVVIFSGATLKFYRGSNKSFFDNISGAGGVTIANSPTAKVRLVSSNSYTGPTTITSGILMIGQGNPGEPGSLASPLVNNNGTLAFNRVENLTYSGSISGSGTVEKQAAGNLVLSGNHTYTGATTVMDGTLVVNGIMGSSAITVSGGTLSGRGTIKGPVTIQSAGRLAPGTSIVTLTISNTLSLAGTTVMELNAATGTNDVVRGLTTITYGGTLTLSNLDGALSGSNSFKLFNAQKYNGVFAALNPATPGVDLAWNTNTLTKDGTVRIVSLSSATMSHLISGNWLTLAWPGDHIGWRLQVQTNSNAIGLGNNWTDVANSISTNEMTLAIDPNTDGAFFRLIYP